MHVLRAKRSAFKSHGGHQISNSLSSKNFFGIFLVPEITVSEKDHIFRLVLKLLLNFKFLTKFGPHTIDSENPGTFPALELKEELREVISTNINKIMNNRNMYYLFL